MADGCLGEPDPMVEIEIDEANTLGRIDERGGPHVLGVGSSEAGAHLPKCRKQASARPVSTGTASERASLRGRHVERPAGPFRLGTLSWLRQRTLR